METMWIVEFLVKEVFGLETPGNYNYLDTVDFEFMVMAELSLPSF
jgi:hypothetical protein